MPSYMLKMEDVIKSADDVVIKVDTERRKTVFSRIFKWVKRSGREKRMQKYNINVKKKNQTSVMEYTKS